MKTKFHYVQDPGHGWLKVPVSELERLEIADQISEYSYLKNGMAYLEEDCDMLVFMNARAQRNEAVELVEFTRNRQSRIRNYPAYVANATTVIASREIVENAQTEATETAENADCHSV